MEKEYMRYGLEMKTLSTVISGEIKEEERRRKEREGVHLPCRITADNKVAVPIYGSLRGYAEIALRASGEDVCDTGGKGTKGCGKCVLCEIYGSLGRRGRALIDDLRSVENYDKVVKKVMHVKLDREEGKVSDALGAEEIQEGTVFTGNIVVLNPKERDTELLNIGIAGINEFGLGGWLTRGRGRVELKIASVEKRSWDTLVEEARKKAKELLEKKK
jgi:CRISPR/Cas system CSM-associated protein Csm3 (group 7 of RAMP superfamily)